MLTIDLNCECGEHGEGVVIFKQGEHGTGMPRGWGFYIKEPERYIVPVCPKCKGTKGPMEIPFVVRSEVTDCKLPGG